MTDLLSTAGRIVAGDATRKAGTNLGLALPSVQDCQADFDILATQIEAAIITAKGLSSEQWNDRTIALAIREYGKQAYQEATAV